MRCGVMPASSQSGVVTDRQPPTPSPKLCVELTIVLNNEVVQSCSLAKRTKGQCSCERLAHFPGFDLLVEVLLEGFHLFHGKGDRPYACRSIATRTARRAQGKVYLNGVVIRAVHVGVSHHEIVTVR